MISCLIIDNNTNSCDLIKNIGNDSGAISFKSMKEDYDECLNIILKNQPEIVFMNLDSKHINLCELLLEISFCDIAQPFFIGLSSLKEKSFDAYKFAFNDFLLKPLSEVSIRKAISKYQKKYAPKKSETICLKSYKDYQYLAIDDILYLKADNNTTDFYMSDGSVIGAYKTLKVFENNLPKEFLRIHKSYIINKNFISRIHYGKSMCIIRNEHKIPFTKTFKENIDAINNLLSKNNIITLN